MLHRIITFALPLGLMLLGACQTSPTTENAPEIQSTDIVQLTDAQLKNVDITLGQIALRPIATTLRLNGRVELPPQNLVSISAPLGGYLRVVRPLPGMYVKKGELLAQIEDLQYIQLQQDYLSAKTQLSFLESEYQRQRELNQSKASSDKAFQQSQSAYQTQVVLLKSLEQKLRLIGLSPEGLKAENISKSIAIVAPMNGYISAVNVNIGKYVSPTEVLFELANTEDLHLRLTVYEKDLPKLRQGQQLYAFTNDQADKHYTCEIILINQKFDNSNAAEVHCHFKTQESETLPIGTFMNAIIALKTDSLPSLPDEAIVRFENQHYVFVAQGPGRFEMKKIKPGTSENGFTALLEAQNLGQSPVVIKGAYKLLMVLKNKEEE